MSFIFRLIPSDELNIAGVAFVEKEREIKIQFVDCAEMGKN